MVFGKKFLEIEKNIGKKSSQEVTQNADIRISWGHIPWKQCLYKK